MSLLIGDIRKRKLGLNFNKLESTFKKPKTQAYTMLVLSLFTISFFGFFALRPTLATIAQLKRQIEDSRKVDKRLSEKINQLVSAQADYEIIAPFVPKIKNALPSTPKYIRTLMMLDKIRRNSTASVSALKIGKVNFSSNRAGSLDINLEADGDFLPLEDLVNTLISAERLLSISAIDFTGGETQKQNTQPEMNVALQLEGPYIATQTAQVGRIKTNN